MARVRTAPGPLHRLCRRGRPAAALAAGRLAAGLLALAFRAGAAPASVPDSGAFKIYQGGRAIGVETFHYVIDADSMLIAAHSRLLPSGAGPDTFFKHANLVVTTADYDLRAYKSNERFGSDPDRTEGVRIRGLVLGDTAMTIYTQVGLMGQGTRVVRPPGRLFVIDPMVYTMFDVIGRALHGRSFERRTLQLLVLSGTNEVLEAAAADLGKETIPWGGRPVVARKLEVSDGPLTFVLWVSPVGRMLKLEEATSGLRVEREPPPVRPRRPPGG